ncbi:MAG TPA: hypothetical protein VHU19_09165 [Pyrinomonadaceae bacterium]|nr:hypothetical protein [Pyrinomonadaceae bacterium]
MRKIKFVLCLLAAFAVAAVAVSIRAQKQSGAHAAQDRDASAPRRDETAHPDCPSMQESKSHTDCPSMSGDKSPAAGEAGGHDAHLAAVNERGERAMGFSQSETTHHFILQPDGGVIKIEINDPKDALNRERIRQHLAHIARMFAAGDFDTPMLVHEGVPPGVPVMRRLKSEISYEYEETDGGARVRIKTQSAEALAAVQDFLRFQITEHQTGDALEVNSR